MTEWGRRMFVTPGVVVDGKLVTNNLVDINLGMRILLGHSFYDDWEGRATRSSSTATRSETPSTYGIRGTSTRCPSRPSATSQGLQLDDVAALVRRQGPPRARHRRRPDRATVVDRAVRSGRHRRLRQGHRAQRAVQPAAHCAQAGAELRVAHPAMEQRDRAQPGAHLLPGLRGCGRAALRRDGPGRGTRRTHRDVDAVHRAGRGDRGRLHRGRAWRAQPPHGDPRRQDRELSPVPADTVERQRARQSTARPARTKTRCRTRRSSKRTRPTGSRASTSCARCAASTRACRAACTCTPATARR